MACSAVQPSPISIASNGSDIIGVAANLILQPGQEQFLKVKSSKPEEVRNSLPVESKSQISILLVPHFKQFLAFLISEVPEVRAVFMHQEGKLLRIFIVVREYDFAVNERIYDKEEHLIDVFGSVDFDFHITTQAHVSDPDLEVILSR